MWSYVQGTGDLIGPAGNTIVTGYSGFEAGKNNPAMQNAHDVGPIPRGMWNIGPEHVDPEKGPVVMALIPDTETVTFGRGGFLIHGDSMEHPGFASHGCIILPRFARQAIAASLDRRLQVV